MEKKNYSYIGISFIILIFGIYAVPKIINRISKADLVTIGKAPAFEFTNQNGERVTNKTMDGKVYVLEFFFTSCGTICPKMNKSMLQIQGKYGLNREFGIISISIDPETDTVETLNKHAQELGISMKNWHLLTGDKTTIYKLANNGFNLFVGENPELEDGFEHSGLFALIDKKGNIRSRIIKNGDYENPLVYYDALDPKGVQMLKDDIKKLLHE
jgi:protein SCO1/2